jgi:hypothetical protein
VLAWERRDVIDTVASLPCQDRERVRRGAGPVGRDRVAAASLALAGEGAGMRRAIVGMVFASPRIRSSSSPVRSDRRIIL